jgi:geranylgeranyl pyrophosphate synthase
MEAILLEPVTYYKNQKGKNIRCIICELLGKLLNVKQDDIDLINDIINNIHNSSLVIDDIEDNSLLRRNEMCSHIKYGIPLALNAGYYCAFKMLNVITNNFRQHIVNKSIEYIYYVHEGQGMDIYYTNNKVIPTIEEYTKMIVYKTGYGFLMLLEVLIDKSNNVVMIKNKEILEKILTTFSIFYQIRDDYINLTDPEYWKIKGFCQDLEEGKISYLLVIFSTICDINIVSDINIIDMMNDKTIDGKKKIVLLLNEYKIFDMVYEKLIELKNDILREMNLDMIFELLPIKKFNINDIISYES